MTLSRLITMMLLPILTISTLAPITTSATISGEANMYRSILQLFSYQYNPTTETYDRALQGSAVYLGNNRVITNAHVILDPDDGETPTGLYELCRSIDYQRDPICFTTARLLAYDMDNDLALLSFASPIDLDPVTIASSSRLDIGSQMTIYGYPQIGGNTITRTEGRVAGYLKPFYKIDGIIDHGNSGGGAFDASGRLIGIPSRILSDNAVIGYMIPIETIGEFLKQKTKTYISATKSIPSDFQAFITEKNQQRVGTYRINDAFVQSSLLKNYHLKVESASYGEGDGAFTYQMTHTMKNTTLFFSCIRVSGNVEKYPIWTFEPSAKIQYMDEKNHLVGISYTQPRSEKQNYVVYNTENHCSIQTVTPFRFDARDSLVRDMQSFLSTGFRLKKPRAVTRDYTSRYFQFPALSDDFQIYEYTNLDNSKTTIIDYLNKKTGRRDTIGVDITSAKDPTDFLSSFSMKSDTPTATGITDVVRLYQSSFPSETVKLDSTQDGIPFFSSASLEKSGVIDDATWYCFFRSPKGEYFRLTFTVVPTDWKQEDLDRVTKLLESATISGTKIW